MLTLANPATNRQWLSAQLWQARYYVVGIIAALLMLLIATASHAQAVPTLAVDADEIQTGLFTGANVILISLGAVVFLLIGFAFGGKILRMIADFIMRFSF